MLEIIMSLRQYFSNSEMHPLGEGTMQFYRGAYIFSGSRYAYISFVDNDLIHSMLGTQIISFPTRKGLCNRYFRSTALGEPYKMK